MRILVVSDNVDTMEQYSRVLSAEGLENCQASSVAAAIHQIELDGRIRVVVSDIMGAGTDVFKILKMLGKHALSNRVEVLICSRDSNPQAVIKAVGLGASDYLVKPIADDLLVEHVKRLASRIGRTVLVVDDEEVIRGLLIKIIERDGYTTLEASGGEEALRILKEHQVDIVVSDIVMPGMDGLRLLVAIKKEYPDLPVLLVSGYGNRYSKDATASGADGFLSKPFKNVEILKQLAALVKSRTKSNSKVNRGF